MRFIGHLAILVLASAAFACTTPRAVAPSGAATPAELRLKVGDSIRIVTKHRERMSLEISGFRETELVGVTTKPAAHETLAEGTPVVVPYGDLALVQVRRISAARTVLMPIVIVGTVLGAGIATGEIVIVPMGP
ncbi:MAG: hypothetical protein NAOJABEB_02651 [Steroidobacteraceae bacterium]|nr:hypothetical protein [Steroidobacteraceae bacterium]